MTEESKISDQTPKRPPGSAQQQPETGSNVDGSMLSINDIHAACQIIDAGTRRGAFGANEAKAIGEVYEKLISFLRQAAPQLFQEPENTQQQEESNNV